ncbi:hypothetical protein [Iodobacter fluviatilis]|uniref:Uncharacterized protein n=1 Tax=Iodobacter fluviatilis TaxID=537 RepID=A0A7G3GBC5_9NEIS|nr:hypothetical protein [Iodobacter fluviatilis]QBC44697.1 hypothetical protein C1H71_14940 [Iodobacter fluviatilis]
MKLPSLISTSHSSQISHVPKSDKKKEGLFSKIKNVYNSSVEMGKNSRLLRGHFNKVISSNKPASPAIPNQPQLNASTLKNKQVMNIIERLVDIVETGRGGMRTLQGEQFNETMTKLAAFYIDLQPDGAFSSGKIITQNSKGFCRPPKDMVNQTKEKGSLYDFMTPYLTRNQDSENFCLQNVTSDLHKWTSYIIEKQGHRLSTEKASEFLLRMNQAADPEITRAEFKQNPASRPPEDQEEAIQFIYYMAGQCDNESDWVNFARDMYTDEYPQLKNVTYNRAREIYDKNISLEIYKITRE